MRRAHSSTEFTQLGVDGLLYQRLKDAGEISETGVVRATAEVGDGESKRLQRERRDDEFAFYDAVNFDSAELFRPLVLLSLALEC